MADFVLVHGGFHGPWCWDRLAGLLDKRGHSVLAPELPVDDPQAGLQEYAAVVRGAMAGLEPAATVLVGHSLGCRVVPLVASEVPVSRMVLVGHVPTRSDPGQSAGDASSMAAMMSTRLFTDNDGLLLLEPAAFARIFYGSCPPDVTAWALSRLRAQAVKPLMEPWPLTQWPDVPVHVVLGADDAVTPLAGALEAFAAELPGQPEPVVLKGDHSPFLGTPEELADALCAALDGRAGLP